MNRNLMIAVAAAVLLVVLAGASLFTVAQTQQVLVTQFGQPVRVITSPGLHLKVPFIQTVIAFDRRLLNYESPQPGEEIILSDQRRLIVDSFTRYRITDPLQYYQSVGPREDVNQVLEGAAKTAKQAGVETQTHPREGEPADALLDVAEEVKADVIVVGNKGMTGAKRFLLGSVPNKVSHHSPCGVWIVRTT